MHERNKVTYEQYVELIRKEVEEKTGKLVSVQKVNKNNGLILDGLTILAEDTNVSQNIYLNGYFEKFLAYGKEAVAEEIIRLYERNKPKAFFDISIFTEKENVSPLIKMRLIHYEKNKEQLEKVPHIRVLDLAVVFMAVLKSDCDNGFGTILIHNQHLKFWDMTTDDLYKLAESNMRNDFNIVSMEKIMEDMLEELMDVELEEIPKPEMDMYVLTTHTRLHGAVGMLHKELLNQFMLERGVEKLVILPSSIHEVLLIPYDNLLEDIDFKAMVKEVNNSQLAPEEILSDNVYLYNGNELEILK